jgi:hypothetical protein
MRVLQIYPYGANLDLDPVDCARLAELCDLGANDLLADKEDLAEAAGVYESVFRALAMAGTALNNMAPLQGYYDLRRDLAHLGLGDLVRPLPGRKEEATE